MVNIGDMEIKQDKVGVLGLGYVGVPLLMSIVDSETQGIGFDINVNRVDDINNGRSYLNTIKDEELAARVQTGRFEATNDMSRLTECDAILICVPTPLNINREPDLSYVVQTTEAVAKYLRKGQLVVLESTTYPGTTEELMKPILERSGLECGKDFFLAYSPEREDPGNINFTTSTTPKVIGGIDPISTQIATLLYQGFINQVITVSSTQTAEAVKLVENIYRAVNIGLVNELKIVLEPMGINIWEVIDAAKTKPFGFTAFYPGPGWGGHCIPIDPFYLTWKAREYGKSSLFIDHAGDVNNQMCEYVVDKTAKALDSVSGRGLRNARVLIIGIAYKSNVDDARESPAIPIIKGFLGRQCEVQYFDPMIPEMNGNNLQDNKSVEYSEKKFGEFDVAVICTRHDIIDWEKVVGWSNIVVDTRNATKNVVNNRDRIFFA